MFVTKPGHTLWTESTETRGGVAILLKLYPTITRMDRLNQNIWLIHCMEVRATYMDTTTMVINVYALTGKDERENLVDLYVELWFATRVRWC